jgi:DNA-binding ferritin-like protein
MKSKTIKLNRSRKARTLRSNRRSGEAKLATKTRANSLSAFAKEVIIHFLEMLNTIKLYHWKTYSYATHKATDELYSKMGENVDRFVEVLLGKAGIRADLLTTKSIPLNDMKTHDEFKRKIENYKSYLINLDSNPAMRQMNNGDLFTIRDELLADLNQFLYLYTFK